MARLRPAKGLLFSALLFSAPLLNGMQALHADNAFTLSPQTLTSGQAYELNLHLPTAHDEAIRQIYLTPGGPKLDQRWPLPQPGLDLAWLDGHVYIAAGDGGLIIIDSDDDDQPIQAQLTLGNHINAITISQGHAWLAARGGLYSVDISNPAAPETRAFIDTKQPVTAVASSDDYVALIQGQEFQLFDSRHPERLQALSSLQLEHPALAIALVGNQLYIAAGEHGVLRYRITRQQQLQRSGHYRTTGPALDIEVNNGIIAIAAGAQGLTLLDGSDPQRLHWLASHQQAGHVLHLSMDSAPGQMQLMLINKQRHIHHIDISNPTMPAILSSQPLQDSAATPTLAPTLALRNGHVMLLKAAQLQRLDFAASPPPYSNEGLDFGQGVNYGGERRVFIRDDIAYVADWFSGIHLYDISTPQRPRLLSSFHTDGSAKGIVVRGHYAYVADDDHGLQIINIRNPRKPFKVSELLTAGLAYIPVLGSGKNKDRLYLASHHGGFQIIDISNPKNPTLLGRYNTAGKSWAIRIRDDIAYIADDNSGLMMFDVSRPDNIQLIGQFSPGGDAEDVILHGDIAYVAFFDRGLYIIDIKDPGYPKKLGHIKTPGNARGIARDGNTLYIADWLSGVQVIDVSTPTKPQLIGSYDTAGAAWGLALKDHFAFVMDWWGGFSVLDISQADTPTLAGRYHQRDRIHAISAQGKVAFAASGSSGLQLFDINNPLNPTWMTGIEFESDATHVVTTPQRAYVALDNKTIAIIDISQPFNAATLRQIRSPHPIIDLRLQGTSLIANHGNKGATFYRIDGKHANKPRKQRQLNEAIQDIALWPDRSIAIAQPNGLIQLYTDIKDKTPSHQFAQKSTLLRSHGDYLISYAHNNGISLLEKNGRLVSRIKIDTPLLDIHTHGDTLYLLDKGQQITVINISNIQQPQLQTHYQTLAPLTRLSIHNGTLYLAGGNSITALQPLPRTSWYKGANDDYGFRIPADMPTGSYKLHINEQRFDNAITLERPKLSKPKFTMEDLNQALKKMNRQPAQPR